MVWIVIEVCLDCFDLFFWRGLGYEKDGGWGFKSFDKDSKLHPSPYTLFPCKLQSTLNLVFILSYLNNMSSPLMLVKIVCYFLETNKIIYSYPQLKMVINVLFC